MLSSNSNVVIRLIALVLLTITIHATSFAQRTCGTQLFNNHVIHSKAHHSVERFEKWLKLKRNAGLNKRKKAEIYQIPVVFHILHNGETEGVGSNIAEARVLEQMNTINADFRRANGDASETPANFQGVAADTEITFVLAKRDPEGLPTSGIERVFLGLDGLGETDAGVISGASNWPSDEYLNVWVVDLSGAGIGFAQFPIADLDGLQSLQDFNAQTDGVYVDYRYIGVNNQGTAFSSVGRTLTHEIGHWLGLRHIWGDGACGVDDFCSDTPLQDDSSSGCPVSGSLSSCGETTMFQNYMDYTDDLCMNMFTICQAERMRTVLENSPRRIALLNSLGGTQPTLVANDLGIRTILSPVQGNCSKDITPQVQLRNYGTNVITNFEIQLLVDDLVIQTTALNDLSLSPEELITIAMNPMNFSQQGIATFKITNVNSTTDQDDSNNCVWQIVSFPDHAAIPLEESFSQADTELDNTWSRISDSDANGLWTYEEANNGEEGNRAAILPYASCENSGSFDMLLSPTFNLTGVLALDISFDYAYSSVSNNFSEGLFVMLSRDCGATFQNEDILFQRWSPSLGTAAFGIDDFEPSGSNDWQTIELTTTTYAQEENVVIAFAGLNNGGNNLYLDNVQIYASDVSDNDVAIVDVINIPAVTCSADFSPLVEIQNLGFNTLNEVSLSSQFNGSIDTESFSDLGIASGQREFLPITLTGINGSGFINFNVNSPNGSTDEDLSNNSLTYNLNVNSEEEFIPFRETFSNRSSYEKWGIGRLDGDSQWEIRTLDNDEQALYANGFSNNETGAESWFVSPAIDLRSFDSASFQFDISYAYRSDRNDRLQILASTDCGISYDSILFDKSGIELAVAESSSAWEPTSIDDWRTESIGLSLYAGVEDLQLAFRLINQNGNNLYVDNIEFFDVAQPHTIENMTSMDIFPNPTSDGFEIQFDFNVKEDIRIRLISLSGETMASKLFPNTLNQRYFIQNLQVPNGLYLVRVTGSSTNLTKRIMIVR